MRKILLVIAIGIVSCKKTSPGHAITGHYAGMRHNVASFAHSDSTGVVTGSTDTTYADTLTIYNVGDSTFSVEGQTFRYNASNTYANGSDPNHYIYSVTFNPANDSLVIYDHAYGGYSSFYDTHTNEFRGKMQ